MDLKIHGLANVFKEGDTASSELPLPKNEKTDFRYLAIFSVSLLLFCHVANLILLLAVQGSLSHALKTETNGWSGEDVKAERFKALFYFYVAGVSNLLTILSAFFHLSLDSDLQVTMCRSRRVPKAPTGNALKQDNSLSFADFYKPHSLVHLALLLLLLVLIGLGILAFVTTTPDNVRTFAIASAVPSPFSAGRLFQILGRYVNKN
ncbi:unnamed protein product [Orchesella dallaii]|uniref:Uncharacterized protein n=1 Tax=Orchesella dallaii TaxID=48710 RepID=A0ABP1RPP5_9HEXA